MCYFVMGGCFWLHQEVTGVALSVCLSGTSLSKALNLHLSFIGPSQICHRSVSGQSRVSLRSVLGQSQVSLGSVSGQSQVSLKYLCDYFVRQTEPKILRLVGHLPRIARTASSLTISMDPLEMK